MAESKDAESMICQETSPSHSGSYPPETLPSNPELCSEEDVHIKRQQEKVIGNSDAKVEQDGCTGQPIEPPLYTSPPSLTEPEYVLENAVEPPSALHGPQSEDLSYFSTKEHYNVSPQHENENSAKDCEVSLSTALNVALFTSEKFHGTSTPDHANISTKVNSTIQLQDGYSRDVPDVQTNKAHVFDKSTEKEVAAVLYEVQCNSASDSGYILNGMDCNICNKVEDETPVEALNTRTNKKITSHSQQNHLETQDMPMKILESALSTKDLKTMSENRGVVYTMTSFESVKEAVTMFGGIVDWKTHNALTMGKRKHAQRELEKVQRKIPAYRKQVEVVEVSKAKVLKELDASKRLVEELKHNLERAQTGAAQAKEDAELAQLRAKEMEDGIAEDASVAARILLEVAKRRNEVAASELKSVKEELAALQKEYVSLIGERDMARRRAGKTVTASREFEKAVEKLILELITTRESLESAHATHHEAEEHHIGAILAKEQDCLNWEKEIKQADEEMHKLNEQLLHSKDLKTNLEAASTLLVDIKKVLAVYMDSQHKEQSESIEEEEPKIDLDESTKVLRLALVSKREELVEVSANIDKIKNDVSMLRLAESSLKSELDRFKATVASIKQREGMASIAVSSLEAEIERTKEEMKETILKEKEAREKFVQLPKLVQLAAIETGHFKSLVKTAREELQNVEEAAEQAKASLCTTEIRIHATLREIEASKASEMLALAAVNALQESKEAAALGESPRGVSLPLEEYYILSKRAHEAEEFANEIITSAIVQIQVAKESKLMTLQRLDKVYMELHQRKEALRVATEQADKAKEGKLGVEQELRKWRAELEQRRRASDAANPSRTPTKSLDESNEAKTFSQEAVVVHPTPRPTICMSVNKTEHVVPKFKPWKKKSFFPRILMFFTWKKKPSQK